MTFDATSKPNIPWVGHKYKERPGSIRITGRPNSPPPELLTPKVVQSGTGAKFHSRGIKMAPTGYLPKAETVLL